MNTFRPATRAVAKIRGGNGFPDLSGKASFTQTHRGVLVTLEVSGLPKAAPCSGGIFALHIHEGESCTGNEADAFRDAKAHYNPYNCPHPYHAGDLPPLFAGDGYAYMTVLTDRFTVQEIVGKVIVVHEGKDDFSTQPAGNAGTKIGCGKILRE